MKKVILAVTFLLALFNESFSQRVASARSILNPASSHRTNFIPTDTLWGNFFKGSPTIYIDTDGGFVAGTNSFGDFAKAQAFTVSNGYTVEGVLLWFKGYIYDSGNMNSTVDVNLYSMNGTGTSNKGTVSAPGSILQTKALLVKDIDTAGINMNAVMFPSPTMVTSNYAIGINLQKVDSPDSVGLVSTSHGDAGWTEMAWEQWNDNKWYTLADSTNSWGYDFDLAVFPVINQLAGFEEMDFINGIRLSECYPNPVCGSATFNYELKEEAQVSLDIFDSSGRLVLRMVQGENRAGKHTFDLNTSALSSGTYYYSLLAGNKRLTKKMIVEK